MKRQPRILAGTAIGLLMASAPLGAYPLQGTGALHSLRHGAPLILARSACAEGDATACAQRQAPADSLSKPRNRKQEKTQEQEPAAEAAPAPKAKPEKPAASEQPAPAAEAAPEQAAPAAEPEKPRKKRQKAKDQAEPTPVEEAAPKAAPEAAPVQPEQAKPSGETGKSPKKGGRKTQDEGAVAPAKKATPKAQPAGKAAPEPEAKPATGTETAPVEPEPKPADQAPAKTEPPANDNQPVGGGKADQPVEGKAPAAQPEAAPILDSQKDAQRPDEKNGKGKHRRNKDKGDPQSGENAPPVDQGPPPADDKAAQHSIQPQKIEPVTEEKGKRVERGPDRDIRKRHRPEGADVLKEIGDRLIVHFNNQTIVESSERPRMTRGARDVYYEDLPRGRTRETIERKSGDKVITIRNSNGDIIQRSRITPDGREHVLSYVDERYREDVRDWRDPGDDLPPLRLTVPRKDYILDSESVDDPDTYYEFLDQPPVEKVQRLYSIAEVKRSARVRDIARRVDLDTLNFDFGSAEIPQAEAEKLQGVAEAMQKLLDRNPAETFLIEGHTDAVGSGTANLALSDQRAEAVAEALTSYFDIPPENLTTQGYGEEYLKVDTQAPERENRRVAIRRITALVAPVASND